MNRTSPNRGLSSDVTPGCLPPVESASPTDLLTELQRGLTFILRRRLRAEDVDDAVQHVLKVTVPQMREQNIADKATMLQFVRTIAVRYAGTFYARYEADAQRRTPMTREPQSGDPVRSVLDRLDEECSSNPGVTPLEPGTAGTTAGTRPRVRRSGPWFGSAIADGRLPESSASAVSSRTGGSPPD
jgi:hypothetical protein